jgi:uncharacterized membrane protein
VISWRTRFRIRQYLKGSLWVVPLLGALGGALVAQLTLAVDSGIQFPEGWRYSSSTASGLLTAIAGAMVGLLGFVVTISVLVVQSATGTLSPRFMRLWYRDRLQKVTLAAFTGLLTFALALLRRVEGDSVPDLGVTLAGFGVPACLVLLLLYLDRFTHRLRPVAVAAIVARAGRRVVVARAPNRRSTVEIPSGRRVRLVRADQDGAIQAIDERGLTALARRHRCRLVFRHAIGDFVTAGSPLVEVVEVDGIAAPPADRRLRDMIAVGVERTIEQDPAFSLRILVDIAIRALSPAVNDPTTAVQVLDHVEALLRVIGGQPLDTDLLVPDVDGTVRLRVPAQRWADYLELAITEIRAYGATSAQVSRRLADLLSALEEEVSPEHRAAVRTECARLAATVDQTAADAAERAFFRRPDRQGIGGPPVTDAG